MESNHQRGAAAFRGTVRPRRRYARIGLMGAGVLLLLATVVVACCLVRVGAAQVGIRVELAGTARGVDDIPIVTGWVLYNPVVERVVVFPTSIHTTAWTQDSREGSPDDESITFSSSEGVSINADVGISFRIEPAKAPHLYLRFRKNNLEDLADGYVRNAVREAFNMAASQRTARSICGAGKADLLSQVEVLLQEKLANDGFVIDQLTFTSGLRLPEDVAVAINRAFEATQLAVQAENRVRQVKAEATQAITRAEGSAQAARVRASGEADARLMTAKAEAKANQVLRASTSSVVLQYRALERWNGRLPMVNGASALPVATLDVSTLGLEGLEDALGADEVQDATPTDGGTALPSEKR